MTTLTASTIIEAPAPAAWAVVADYGRDPEWRDGVETMAPSPSGPVRVGTTTAEVMHLAGRTYRNGGEVTDVHPGQRFAWRTTSGADADGSRSVRALADGSCEVTLVLTVRAHGFQRLLQPVLVPVLRKGLAADLTRLRDLVLAEATASVA